MHRLTTFACGLVIIPVVATALMVTPVNVTSHATGETSSPHITITVARRSQDSVVQCTLMIDPKLDRGILVNLDLRRSGNLIFQGLLNPIRKDGKLKYVFLVEDDLLSEALIDIMAERSHHQLVMKAFVKEKANHGLESTGAPPAAGTPETHP